MDIFEKEKFLKDIFRTFVNYVNGNLKSFCNKELNIDFKIEQNLNNINVFADVKDDGTYTVGVTWTRISLD